MKINRIEQEEYISLKIMQKVSQGDLSLYQLKASGLQQVVYFLRD